MSAVSVKIYHLAQPFSLGLPGGLDALGWVSTDGHHAMARFLGDGRLRTDIALLVLVIQAHSAWVSGWVVLFHGIGCSRRSFGISWLGEKHCLGDRALILRLAWAKAGHDVFQSLRTLLRPRKGACIVAFVGWFRLVRDLALVLIIFAGHDVLANTRLLSLLRFNVGGLHIFS